MSCFEKFRFTLFYIIYMVIMPFMLINLGIFVTMQSANKFIIIPIQNFLSCRSFCLLHYLLEIPRFLIIAIIAFIFIWVGIFIGLFSFPFTLIPAWYINSKQYCRIMKWWSKSRRQEVAIF